MSQSLNHIKIGTNWVNLNTLSGIQVGTQFKIQNLDTRTGCRISEGNMPINDKIGGVINSRNKYGSTVLVVKDSLAIWVKSESSDEIYLSLELV